jgi:hypothetical protein
MHRYYHKDRSVLAIFRLNESENRVPGPDSFDLLI